MANSLYARYLNHAVAAEGSTAAVAQTLHVPEQTLLRWIAGGADMPLRGFERLLELLMMHETAGRYGRVLDVRDGMTFQIGKMLAGCRKCGANRFVAPRSDEPLRLTSALRCMSWGEEATQFELIVELARRSARLSRRRL